MSAEVRQLLADIASAVEGIEVTPNYRQSIGAGDGMVRRDRTDYRAFGSVVTWQVVIALPKDLVAAQDWLDVQVPAVAAALRNSHELDVRSVEPQQLALDTGSTYPIALITGVREEE